MKKAEGSDSLIFHAYVWAGKTRSVTFTVPKGATGAILTNLLEQPQGSPLTITGNQLTVPIHPFEILTLRVDYLRGQKEKGLVHDGDAVVVPPGTYPQRN
jgi:alpha-mannosidase